MNKPTDRLHYADCAYIEEKLQAEAKGADAAAGCAPSSLLLLSPEALYAIYLRFWTPKRESFDHPGFARAIAQATQDQAAA